MGSNLDLVPDNKAETVSTDAKKVLATFELQL